MTNKRGQNAGRSWEDLPVVEVPKAEEPKPVEEDKMIAIEEHPVDDGTMDDAAWMRQMMSGTLEDEPVAEPEAEAGGAKAVEVVSSTGKTANTAEDVSQNDLLL